MLVEIDNRWYKIFFKYSEHSENTKDRRRTTCVIAIDSGETEVVKGKERTKWIDIIATGTSCGKYDNFCKDTGRKIALTRALALFIDENMYPFRNKEHRQSVWENYFMETRRPGKTDDLLYLDKETSEKFLGVLSQLK